jgi:hypothetical protein
MKIAWAAIDELFNELGKIRASSPFCGQITHLLFTGNLAGQEEPEQTLTTLAVNSNASIPGALPTFWQWLLTTRGFR